MIKGYQEKVINLYEKIRKENADTLEARKIEVYTKVPRIKTLDTQIRKAFFDLSTSPFRDVGDIDKYTTELKAKVTDLKFNKSELLVANGFPIDYIDPIYICRKCSDTGFIGHIKCECFQKNLVRVYYDSSELKNTLKTHNFSRFRLDLFDNHRYEDMDSPRRNMERILEKTRSYIDNFGVSDENLFFYGSAGTGKTFLTDCIASELLSRGYLVIYKTADDLITSLRDIKFDKNEMLDEALTNCDVLIIDDLGTESNSDFSRTEFYNILNKKLLKNKKMIISSNFSLEKLMQRYSERITSRLLGNFTIHKFYGDDLRIKLNLKRIQ